MEHMRRPLVLWLNSLNVYMISANLQSFFALEFPGSCCLVIKKLDSQSGQLKGICQTHTTTSTITLEHYNIRRVSNARHEAGTVSASTKCQTEPSCSSHSGSRSRSRSL